MKNDTGLKDSKQGKFVPCCINGTKNMTLFSKSVVFRKNSELQRFPSCLKQGSVLSEAISILILNISI